MDKVIEAIDTIINAKSKDESTSIDKIVEMMLMDGKLEEFTGPYMMYNFQAFQNAIRGALMGTTGSKETQRSDRAQPWLPGAEFDLDHAGEIIDDLLPKVESEEEDDKDEDDKKKPKKKDK